MHKSTEIAITITVVPFVTHAIAIPCKNNTSLCLLKAIAIHIEASLPSDGVTWVIDQRNR